MGGAREWQGELITPCSLGLAKTKELMLSQRGDEGGRLRRARAGWASLCPQIICKWHVKQVLQLQRT